MVDMSVLKEVEQMGLMMDQLMVDRTASKKEYSMEQHLVEKMVTLQVGGKVRYQVDSKVAMRAQRWAGKMVEQKAHKKA